MDFRCFISFEIMHVWEPKDVIPNAYSNSSKLFIQSDSWLTDITAEDVFLGLCDQKRSYKHVSDFGRLGIYGRLKLRLHIKDYWNKWNKILTLILLTWRIWWAPTNAGK